MSKAKNKPGFSMSGDERGLTPVLAVTLLIGIFATFFAAWFGAVAPVWQRDQEVAHMDSVFASFLRVKRATEEMLTLYLVEYAALEAGATPLTTDYSYTVDVKLNSDPLPLLGWYTTGSIAVKDSVMKFNATNPHYVPQKWVYENGAVILVQEDRSVMRSSPSMVTVKQAAGTYIEVWVTTVKVRGEDEMAGSGGATVELELNSLSYAAENQLRGSVEVTVYNNLLAWQNYFLAKRDAINSSFGSSVSEVESTDTYVKLIIKGKSGNPGIQDIYYWERNVEVNAYLL